MVLLLIGTALHETRLAKNNSLSVRPKSRMAQGQESQLGKTGRLQER